MKTQITLKESFLRQHPNYPIIIRRWEESTNTKFTFSNITTYNLKLFKNHLCSIMSRNGAKTYISKLSSVLNLHADTHKLPYNWKQQLSIKSDASQQIYLTKQEIAKIHKYKPKTHAENIVKLQFVLGCLTGARRSDYINFTKSNIINNSIVYCSKKTGINTSVPATKTTISIINELDKYSDKEKKFSQVYYNKTLHNICKNIKLSKPLTLHRNGKTNTLPKYKYITSHTARRSFATNMYIDNVDIYTISKMCGHSSVAITQRYICINGVITHKIKKVFDEYDYMLN